MGQAFIWRAKTANIASRWLGRRRNKKREQRGLYMLTRVIKPALALLLGLSSALAVAAEQEREPLGLFMAGIAGSIDVSDYDDDFPDADLLPGLGIQLYAGLSPAEWFSIKAGWRTYGLQTVEGSGYEAELDVTGTFVEADLLAPITDQFLLGVTAGRTDWDLDESIDIGFAGFSGDVSGADTYYGAKLRVIPPQGGMSVDMFVTQISLSDNELTRDIDFLSIGAGINLHF